MFIGEKLTGSVAKQHDTKPAQELVPCEDSVAEEIETVTMDTEESVEESERDGEGEGEREAVTSNQQPMDLGSPLDSDPEFVLVQGEQEDAETSKTESQEEENTVVTETETETEHQEVEKEVEEKKEVEKEKEIDEKKESEETVEEGNREKRVERLDSTFDPSYEPGSEELLYEGDPETETKQDATAAVELKEQEETPAVIVLGDDEPTSPEKEGATEATSAEHRSEEDEGFMVEVHYKDQGGSLEDPAPSSTLVPPREVEKKGGKSSADAGKTTGDSARFVLPFFSPFLSTARVGYPNWSTLWLFQLECTWPCSN